MANECNMLPRGSGPHTVGCTDIMTTGGQEGTFMRVYYPCTTNGSKMYPPTSLMPRHEYTAGLVSFLRRSQWLFPHLINRWFGRMKASVYWNAQLDGKEAYPLLIFSHGLGGFRSLYSTVCIDMASQGFVVGAVEHRDESASATYSIDDDGQEKWISFRHLQQGEKEFPLRNKQVEIRAEECIRALHLFEDFQNGCPVENLLPVDFKFTSFQGCIDLKRVAIMGHSFGGATAILAAHKEADFRCAIVLDGWMVPLHEDLLPVVKKPLFFINSETFHWPVNVAAMLVLLSNQPANRMITLLGTGHLNQSDCPFAVSGYLGRLLGTRGPLDPKEAMRINNCASLAFLHKHLELVPGFEQWDELVEGKGEHVMKGSPVKPFVDGSSS
uniref:platelet-activating factor acetylhydrolase 2, cytoplasmic-like n=1 Tax=Myxine glutinosa TaxID=7769 RepID=UPI00358F84D6